MYPGKCSFGNANMILNVEGLQAYSSLAEGLGQNIKLAQIYF
jgi:hypothetical protein